MYKRKAQSRKAISLRSLLSPGLIPFSLLEKSNDSYGNGENDEVFTSRTTDGVDEWIMNSKLVTKEVSEENTLFSFVSDFVLGGESLKDSMAFQKQKPELSKNLGCNPSEFDHRVGKSTTMRVFSSSMPLELRGK